MLKLAPVGRAKAHVEQGDGVDFRQRKQPEESKAVTEENVPWLISLLKTPEGHYAMFPPHQYSLFTES